MNGRINQWRITEGSLRALAETPEWKEFARSWLSAGRSPITPEWVYGPEGVLSHLWFTSWDTANAMRDDVTANHGGGIPIPVINRLIELSHPA